QAEDGIRAGHVTGVQTCALPIFDDLAAIERQFHHFVRTVPRAGLLVVNGDDEALERVLAKGTWTPVERLGAADGWEAAAPAADRSEERRVGKACRSAWAGGWCME